jgi:hypothetical protein
LKPGNRDLFSHQGVIVRKFIKNITFGAFGLAALALTGCFGDSSTNPNTEEGFATVVLQTKTGGVNKLSKPGLGKASVIALDSLYVTAISDASTPDTVIVALAVGDSGLTSSSTTEQNIGIVMNLKALRSWTISAYTVDANDSVIQSGDTAIGIVFAGQTKFVTFEVNPLWTMYTATFNFPDSIFSPSGNFGQNISLTKIELLVDDELVDDMTAAFEDSTDYVLAYDYVAPSADSVTLKVYGNIENADAPYDAGSNLLYSKTVAISSLTVGETPNDVELAWQGPLVGHADLTVSLQPVGQVAIAGETPPEVLSKK